MGQPGSPTRPFTHPHSDKLDSLGPRPFAWTLRPPRSGCQRGVTFGHCLLHRDRAAHRVDDAGELDQEPVAGGLDDAAVMAGYFGIDHLGAERFEPAEGPF